LTGSDRLAGAKRARSAFLEDILRQSLRERPRAQPGARDIELINRPAEWLNRDAEDGLEDQARDEGWVKFSRP